MQLKYDEEISTSQGQKNIAKTVNKRTYNFYSLYGISQR